jgi:hypothetical protein
MTNFKEIAYPLALCLLSIIVGANRLEHANRLVRLYFIAILKYFKEIFSNFFLSYKLHLLRTLCKEILTFFLEVF